MTNEEINQVPDWAVVEAARRTDTTLAPESIRDYARDGVHSAVCIIAHAITIAKHEKPPVDDDIRICREACAQVSEEYGEHGNAKDYRTGKLDNDNDREMQSCRKMLAILREEGKLP